MLCFHRLGKACTLLALLSCFVARLYSCLLVGGFFSLSSVLAGVWFQLDTKYATGIARRLPFDSDKNRADALYIGFCFTAGVCLDELLGVGLYYSTGYQIGDTQQGRESRRRKRASVQILSGPGGLYNRRCDSDLRRGDIDGERGGEGRRMEACLPACFFHIACLCCHGHAIASQDRRRLHLIACRIA